MKKLINITNFIGSIGGEHYYAKARNFELDKDIYLIANDKSQIDMIIESTDAFNILRKIDSKEAMYLNKKDGKGSNYKEGDETSRFNSIPQIKEVVKNEFPEDDIIFLLNGKMTSEDMNVIQRNPEEYKKTGEQIRIHNFQGFSDNFKNLTEGSLHDVIHIPKRYEGRELQKGKWVMGVYEPALVLEHEYQTV